MIHTLTYYSIYQWPKISTISSTHTPIHYSFYQWLKILIISPTHTPIHYSFFQLYLRNWLKQPAKNTIQYNDTHTNPLLDIWMVKNVSYVLNTHSNLLLVLSIAKNINYFNNTHPNPLLIFPIKSLNSTELISQKSYTIQQYTL